MNERIKELLIKSGLMDSIGCNAYEEDGWEPVVSKFTELLIRECVTKMALEIMDEQWVDEAVKNTYTHFGVEE